MKKLDFIFIPKNVINCVDNEPALWDTEFTDVHPEITARINSNHWLSFLEAYSAIRIISVSVSDILFKPCFRFFMAGNIDFV